MMTVVDDGPDFKVDMTLRAILNLDAGLVRSLLPYGSLPCYYRDS